MVQRLTYRKRHSYATKSNQHRVVKTPGIPFTHVYMHLYQREYINMLDMWLHISLYELYLWRVLLICYKAMIFMEFVWIWRWEAGVSEHEEEG